MTTRRDPAEPIQQFENRKQDHLRLALDPANEAVGLSGLQRVRLAHEAIPDLNFADVDLSTQCLGLAVPCPLFISSMTAGHQDAININEVLAIASAERGWLMGVGSQRRQLFDDKANAEWQAVRKQAPNARLLGNIGLAQIIQTPTDAIQALVDSLQAKAMFIHTNPLQECLQPEGTPQFKGAYEAIARTCEALSVPVIIKETGCGFSAKTLARLQNLGVAAVDVSGFGGTHWGRIEGQRNVDASVQAQAATTFKHWGISTLESLQAAVQLKPDYEVWGSGGVRSGLDAAKLVALGARMVGLAKPMLEAALCGVDAVLTLMETLETEFKIACFCTGSQNCEQLRENTIHEIG